MYVREMLLGGMIKGGNGYWNQIATTRHRPARFIGKVSMNVSWEMTQLLVIDKFGTKSCEATCLRFNDVFVIKLSVKGYLRDK